MSILISCATRVMSLSRNLETTILAGLGGYAFEISCANFRRAAALPAIPALLALGAATPLQASTLSQVYLDFFQDYSQRTASAPTAPSSYVFSPTNYFGSGFTSETLTWPGPASTAPLSAFGSSIPEGYSTLAAFQAAFPFGTYAFNFTGSPSYSESINYAQNVFKSSVPAFTSGTFNGLQGMNPANAFTVNFNAFTPNPSASGGYIDILMYKQGQPPAIVLGSGLPTTTTSVVIPASKLLAGTQYSIEVDYVSYVQTTDGATGVLLNQDFLQDTSMTFTTASTLNTQGGSPSAPVYLFSAQPVGQVTGTISGPGSEDYYLFGWGGGAFSATASITGASAGASYLFSEGAPGVCADGGSATLNNGDSFSSTIAVANLAAGLYCIGLNANSGNDPAFALTFNTPLQAQTVPEPGGFILPSLGLGMFIVLRLAKR